ncbi:hypothetical protein [Marinirhabdus gelatinilytica]|uniref:Uncharacterized protein n=1 Tax=Marinirhabdus gelatinilytica TaxID=1703343 RepID=A0A370QJ63_9FLAO|nr:hypothetical protein [Marinirhabdus gelatinilytica]RDK88407.1 hypothetical protein C8D94_101278 [Marinirhabdus gelatinilytica]
MKQLLFYATFLCGFLTFAQVGIGTTNPSAELEVNSTASGLPTLQLNPQTTPVGSAAGQISVIGDRLYLFDATRSKWLTVESSTVTFGLEGDLNNKNLEYAGDIQNNGPNMPYNGTVVYAAINSSGGSLTKGITLEVYNSLRNLIQTHNYNLVDGRLLLTDLNIDFSAGDYFLVKVDDDTTGSVKDVSMVIWSKWRQ